MTSLWTTPRTAQRTWAALRGCPQGLGQPAHRSTLQPHRGLPTFPQAPRLITRSRENNPANVQAIRQTRLSLVRQWHGWTLAEYREAFQLRAMSTPTMRKPASELLTEHRWPPAAGAQPARVVLSRSGYPGASRVHSGCSSDCNSCARPPARPDLAAARSDAPSAHTPAPLVPPAGRHPCPTPSTWQPSACAEAHQRQPRRSRSNQIINPDAA